MKHPAKPEQRLVQFLIGAHSADPLAGHEPFPQSFDALRLRLTVDGDFRDHVENLLELARGDREHAPLVGLLYAPAGDALDEGEATEERRPGEATSSLASLLPGAPSSLNEEFVEQDEVDAEPDPSDNGDRLADGGWTDDMLPHVGN